MGAPTTKGLPPTHPGELLKEIVIPGLGISVTEFASHLGLASRQTLYDLFNKRIGVSAQLALRLGKATGSRPAYWLDLQREYDLRVAEEEFGEEIAKIKPLHKPLQLPPAP